MNKSRPTKKPKMVSVRIPEDLHENLKQVALSSSLPLRDLIEKLLRQHVRAHNVAFEFDVKATQKQRKA